MLLIKNFPNPKTLLIATSISLKLTRRYIKDLHAYDERSIGEGWHFCSFAAEGSLGEWAGPVDGLWLSWLCPGLNLLGLAPPFLGLSHGPTRDLAHNCFNLLSPQSKQKYQKVATKKHVRLPSSSLDQSSRPGSTSGTKKKPETNICPLCTQLKSAHMANLPSASSYLEIFENCLCHQLVWPLSLVLYQHRQLTSPSHYPLAAY